MNRETRLRKAMSEVDKHRKEIDQFYEAVSQPLQIQMGKVSKDNLWRILLLSNSFVAAFAFVGSGSCFVQLVLI